MELIYKDIIRGIFISRPNRFVIWMEIDGKPVKAHMPNPGRMRELLFPGTVLYAVPHAKAGGATSVRVIGCERDGEVIPLDTTHANDVAEWLVNQGKIPGWEDCHVVRREVTMGDSRFDLVLSDGKETFPVEVKSCTLFGKQGAMFPDAVTERGRKHIRHLGDIGKAGGRAGLLVLVQWDRARWFLPDYHTDPDFASSFCEAMPHIEVKPVAIHWEASFSMPDEVRLLPVPVWAAEEEMGNAGDYLVILQVERDMDLSIGRKGTMHFPKGYYVYVGSAKKNLDQRIAHHRHVRKKMHWHMDYLRKETQWVGVIPIRTKADLEHSIAQAVAAIADWSIPGFGCTDCDCQSHLFGFHENPMHLPAFVFGVEERFEMNRMDEVISDK